MNKSFSKNSQCLSAVFFIPAKQRKFTVLPAVTETIYFCKTLQNDTFTLPFTIRGGGTI